MRRPGNDDRPTEPAPARGLPALPAAARAEPDPGSRAADQDLGGATLWAKREDMNSPYAFGGNKTRKLEYLVADALALGCDTLVSIGAQSNHTPARSRPRPRWPA